MTGANSSVEYPQENKELSLMWEVVENVDSSTLSHLWDFHIEAGKLTRILSELNKSYKLIKALFLQGIKCRYILFSSVNNLVINFKKV